VTKRALQPGAKDALEKSASIARATAAKTSPQAGRPRRRRTTDSALHPVDGVNYDMLPQQVGFWVRRAQLAVMRSFEEYTRNLDLRPVETAAILILDGNPNITQIALAAALGSDQSTMVAISTKLEKRGLIERRRALEDRRYQLISLTPKGGHMAHDIREALAAHDRSLTRNMSGEQRKQLVQLLKQLVDI